MVSLCPPWSRNREKWALTSSERAEGAEVSAVGQASPALGCCMMCRAQPTLGHVGTGTCFCVEVFSFSDLQLDALLVDPAPVSSLLESVPTQASCEMAPGCPTAGTWGSQRQPEATLLAGTCHGLFSRHFVFSSFNGLAAT